MAVPCVRSITFTIPDPLDGPGVQVTVVEQDGNLVFTVNIVSSSGKSADLRGLFFHIDPNKHPGLQITNPDSDITGSQIGNNSVKDLGNGVNMNGAVKDGFDVGVKFGTPGIGKDDVKGPVSFTLDGAQDLTLDDIAHMQFGARTTSVGSKLTVTAPAAPDAHDDAFNIFEDGASALTSPSKTPAPVVFNVLANDTDEDAGDVLSVVGFDDGPDHGTVAISADGHSVLYTPNLDYSGPDSFEYCISDGHGGTDFATVNVTVVAVADDPVFTYTVSAGDTVFDIVIDVTATQNDYDSSEFIDRIDVGSLPAGVTILSVGDANPAGEPDQIVQQFVLSLPHDVDSHFDLNFTAVSQETSNSDQETSVLTIPIELDVNHNETNLNFIATDGSIWGADVPTGIDKDNFWGIDDSWSGGFDAWVAEAGGEVTLKTGLHSVLHVNFGSIDAHLPFDVIIDTAYNKTTDQLLMSPSALLGEGGGFTTDGPDGSYNLDFLFYLDAYAHGSIIGIGFDTHFGGPFGSLTDPALEIIDIDSDDASIDIPIPSALNPIATITISFPDVNTTSEAYDPNVTDTIHSKGSDDIFNVDLDALALAFAIIGIPNPLDIGVGTILGLHFNAAIDLRQEFDLQALGLNATLTFENGSSQAFDFNSDLVIDTASILDLDNNGVIDFELTITPDASLENKTKIGGSIGANLTVLDFDGFDPLVSIGGDIDLGAITVYQNSFAFDQAFTAQDYLFAA